jgi:hypothetical protein
MKGVAAVICPGFLLTVSACFSMLTLQFYHNIPPQIHPNPVPDAGLPRLSGTIPPLDRLRGRIVFDCPHERCVVSELRGDEHVPVCETPCWNDFDYGPHRFTLTPLNVPSCDSGDFWHFDKTGICISSDASNAFFAVATTKPVVLLVNPGYESHDPPKKLREVHRASSRSFETAVGGPYGAAPAM